MHINKARCNGMTIRSFMKENHNTLLVLFVLCTIVYEKVFVKYINSLLVVTKFVSKKQLIKSVHKMTVGFLL